MCKPKPYPRCSNHAIQRLKAAHKALQTARDRAESTPTPANLARLRQAERRFTRAADEYETCPKNIRSLEDKVQQLREAGEDASEVEQRLSSAKERRALLIHNGNLETQAQERLAENARELEELEARANRDITPEVLATERAALAVEEAREQLIDTSNVIANQYLDQGNHTYAWNPGLWRLDHETEDGQKTPEYQAYVDAYDRTHAAQRAFEQARAQEGHVKLQIALDKMTLEHRTAEIASGLHGGNTYEAYGATMVNPDGTTNAHYLTRIPGTNTPYFARVVKIQGKEVQLETGERLSLKEARMSNWKYTFPEAGATRGPELYRMDSSD